MSLPPHSPDVCLGEEDRRQHGDQLVSFLYSEVKALARRHLAHERAGHTLTATALVNELYLKMAPNSRRFPTEAEFIMTASRAIRNILVDHARGRRRLKRSGETVSIEDLRFEIADDASIEVETLDEALKELAEVAERQARVVQLRFFGALSIEETAAALSVSPKTVKRDWVTARAWLKSWLAGSAGSKS